MVKGVDFKVGLSKFIESTKAMSEEELAQVTKKVEEAVKKDVKTVGEIPAEALRARYASQLDTPILSRFKPEPFRIPDPTRISREKLVELLTDTIKCNAPKTKEEALSRLDNAASKLKKMNVEVSEDMIQTLKNDIIKKFGE